MVQLVFLTRTRAPSWCTVRDMMPPGHVVRAAVAGDSEAGGVVAEWLVGELSSFFAKRFHDSSKVEELLQATMTRVWAELAARDPSDADELRLWCLDVGRRTAGNSRRQARREHERVGKLDLMQVARPASLSATLAAAEELDLLERCIEQLATPYREVIRDKLQGGTARSLAEARGVSIDTIYARRKKAQKQLAELMARERLTPPPGAP